MKLSELIKGTNDSQHLMSGNEAFARGLFESGIIFSCSCSDTLSEVEKHLSLNVAVDPVHTFPHSGVNRGMLILSGGDTGIVSTTKTQYNRIFSLHTKIPIIEPTTVQECKEFIKEGLKISELYNVPIYVHVTTRLCHSYGIVTYGIVKEPKKIGKFKKIRTNFTNTLRRALANHEKYSEIIVQIRKNKKLFYLFNKVKINQAEDEIRESINNDIWIITSGLCYSYVIQACRKLKINPPILKLGMIFPINREEICQFVNQYGVKNILVVEELEPFIENSLKEILYNYWDIKKDTEIHGKDFLPSIGEFNTHIIMRFFFEHFNIKTKYLLDEIDKKEEALKEIRPMLPKRDPNY